MTGSPLMVLLVWIVGSEMCGGVPTGGESRGALRRRVVSSWCEYRSVGVGYSDGREFSCGGEKRVGREMGENLEGITLKIGIIEGDDFEYDCSATASNGRVEPKDSYSGYLLTMLREVLRFDAKFLSSTSWGYYEDSNHTWKGLTGLLATNMTDMAACHWTTNEHLFDLADFLFPTLETTQSFVYLPQNIPLMGDIFVEALSRRLWVFFLLSIFSLMASFWFSTYVHSKVRPGHEPWSWDEVTLWAVAAISQQSYSRHPRGASCRTMFLIGYTITYLLYTGFAAGITSLLALKSNQKELTLDEVAQMKLHLLLLQDDYNIDFFEKYDSKFAYLNLQRGGGDDLHQIFHKIKRTNFLGYGSTVTLLDYLKRKVDAQHRATFVVVPAPKSTRRKAFLVQKSFPYKRLFNYWLLRFRETGFLDLGKKRYLTSDDSGSPGTTGWFSAGLDNVSSAVVFLFGGWLLSAAVLAVEILRGKKKKRE